MKFTMDLGNIQQFYCDTTESVNELNIIVWPFRNNSQISLNHSYMLYKKENNR